MKKFIITILLAVLATGALAQDSIAAAVVDRYLAIMNYESFNRDSVVYVESILTDRYAAGDTLVMKRWYFPPNSYRIEIWNGRHLEDACTNYKDSLFLQYSPRYRDWRNVSDITYFGLIAEHPFRSPLYGWRASGAELYYRGEKDFQGHPVDEVFVRIPGSFDRHYLFDKANGLFFLYIEDTTAFNTENYADMKHVDWRSVQEYIPFGSGFYPSEESYQFDGHIYIIHNTIRRIPFDRQIFIRKER